MKIKHIAAHVALIVSFGMAASAQAQLLGGGGLGGMLGGAGGMGGQIGGQIGGAGSMGGRGALINEMRPARAIEAAPVRRAADISGRGEANGNASGNGAASLAGNILPSRNRAVEGEAAGSSNVAGSMDADLAGSGRRVLGGTASGLRAVGQPIAEGARAQVDSTSGYASSTVANVRGTAQGGKNAAINGARRAGNAVKSVQVEKSVNLSVGGSASGSASGSGAQAGDDQQQ